MSLGGILILVLLVVSLFVFIYLIVITSKSWGILQTILLCFLFIECWVFLLFAGRALDKRLAMLKEYSTTSANVDKLTKEVYKLTYGGDNVAEDQEAFIPLSGKARRLAADRGRVWRNVSKAGFDNGTLRLELTSANAAPAAEDPAAVPVDGQAAPAPAAAGSVIPANMIVYVFSQGSLDPAPAAAAPVTPASPPAEAASPADAAAPAEGTEPAADGTEPAATDAPAEPPAEAAPVEAASGDGTGGKDLPKAYIGEFRVSESAPGSVSLQPISALRNDQLKNIDDADGFVLYEALPQDSHDIFVTQGAQPSEQAIFGQANAAILNQLLQAVPAERRQALLDAYLRDGTDSNNNDPTENVWLFVEVVKPIKLDVDGAKTSATTGTYFDINGRTVDSRLMLGAETKEVTIAEGKQLLLPQSKDVTNYVSNGDLKVLRKVYIRPLNAYESGLTELRVRLTEMSRLLEAAQREGKLLEDANTLNEQTRQAYIQLSQRLTADRDKYQQEIDALTSEVAAVTAQVKSTSDQLRKYWKAVHAQRDQIFGQQ